MVRPAETSDPLVEWDRRNAPRHRRIAAVTSDAEPAKRQEPKTLITLVFVDYA
jgi:hypothetical protein